MSNTLSNTISELEVPYITKAIVEHLETIFDIRTIIVSKYEKHDVEYLRGIQEVLSYIRNTYEHQQEDRGEQ